MSDEAGWNDLPGGGRMHLALYKYDACPYCQRVLRALRGSSARVELRDTLEEARWRADLRARTGRTQVPCLLVDDAPMFESGDIVAWLQANFPS